MIKKVEPINTRVNGIRKREIRRNLIIEGVEKGETVLLRGEYVRFLIWKALSDQDSAVEINDLICITQCTNSQVKSWLDAWSEKGYVSKNALLKSKTGGKRFVYEILKKSDQPPPIDLKGNAKPVEQRQYIWDAARNFSARSLSFTVDDLVSFAADDFDITINIDYAQSYLRDLYHACYFDSTANPQDRDPIYFMHYDTGTMAPSVRRGKSIFDPNLGVVVR